MASILIGTPTRGDVKAAYAKTIFGVQRDLIAAGHDVDLLFTRGSDVIYQRNVIASFFLERQDFTHLLCVDDDMDFRSGLPRRMLSMNRPLVGVTYPWKRIDLATVVRIARETAIPTDEVVTRAQQYVFRACDQPPQIVNGACQASGVGFGVALVQRSTLSGMIEHGAVREQRDRRTQAEGLRGSLYGFFDKVDDLGEDFSFCRRWTDMGGEVFCILDEDVGHVGDIRYGRPLLARGGS